MRKAVGIEHAEGDGEVLERWSRSKSAAVRLRERSRSVRRYADEGLKGIERERPRGGNHGDRCPQEQAALRTEIIRRTTRERPPDATHRSCRSLARAVGTTHSFVNTVWRGVAGGGDGLMDSRCV